jgi:hypothetical protein
MQGIAAAEETTADERKNANTGPKETSLSPSEHALAHRRHYSHDGCVALDVDDAILPGDAQLERPAGTKPAAPTRYVSSRVLDIIELAARVERNILLTARLLHLALAATNRNAPWPNRMRRSQSCASAKMPQTTSPSRTGGLCFQAYSLSRDCNSYAPVSLGPERYEAPTCAVLTRHRRPSGGHLHRKLSLSS